MSDNHDDPVVVVADVDVTYRLYAQRKRSMKRLLAGDRQQREYRSIQAVKGASLVVQAGESIGVIGHNGSGKSTLLRAIGGLMPVTRGAVYVRSVPVLLGVKAALQPELSARSNVYLGGTALRIPRKVLTERMDEIIEFAGLEEFIDLPIRAFSSGMKARLQFAISTVVSPDILLIDEALSVGDAEFKAKSDERLQDMMEDVSTIFLVSHSMGSVMETCERAIWLDHGSIVADGPSRPVCKAYAAYVASKQAPSRKRRQADVSAS